MSGSEEAPMSSGLAIFEDLFCAPHYTIVIAKCVCELSVGVCRQQKSNVPSMVT
jgi:hypothetical protein